MVPALREHVGSHGRTSESPMPSPDANLFAAAEQRHHEAVARRDAARDAGDIDAWIAAAFDCGMALFDLEQYGLALRLFGEAIKLIEEHGERRDLLPEALGMSGRTMQRAKRWNDVLPWYRRAAQAAADQRLPVQQLRWQLKEATTNLDMNREEQGRKLLEAAINAGREMSARGEPVTASLADALQRLAGLESTSREQADAQWDEALQLLDTLPPSQDHFRAAVNRAGLFAQRDQHWLAQTHFEEALEVGEAIGIGESQRRQLLLRLAATLRLRNEAALAGQLLMEHLPGEVESRDRHEFLTQAVDGFFAAHDWPRMKGVCVQLREARRDMRPGWRFDAQMRLSIALRGLKDYAASLAALDEAEQHALAWGDPQSTVKVRGQRAIVLLDLGEHAKAAAIGEALWAEGSRDGLTARTLVRALIGAGKLDRAEALAQEFEAGSDDELAAARLRAYLADAGRGDPSKTWYAVGAAANRARGVEAEALTRLIELSAPGSDDRFEQTRHRLRLLDYARMKVDDVFSDASWRAAIEEADEFPGWLDQFVIEAQRGNRDAVAIYELERFRAQSLVNLLAERAALWSGGEPGRGWIKGQATSRWQRARYRYQALAARGAGWRKRRALAQDLERYKNEAFSAAGLIHVAPAEQGLHFPQDLAELLGEHRLATGEAIVFAHSLPQGLALWLFDSTGATRHTVLAGLARERVRAIDEILRAIGEDENAPLPQLAPLLAELDATVGVPLAAWLGEAGVRRAFLCAGTQLAALPLDCCASLLDADAELVLLPSGAALGFARGVRRPLPQLLFLVTQEDRDRTAAQIMRAAQGRTLLLVDPTRDLDFAPLEAAVVACAHHGREVETIDADHIDGAGLARACGQAEVLHFCGHGDFDDANPYRSGIWIGPRDAPESIWANGDIFGDVEAPGARLAVLSGCQTGQTRPNLVSEEVSLPAAFIAAGYAAVVASRWAVDDLSSTLLMGEFHRRWLGGGISVAAALAGSRRWLRELTREQAQALVDGLAGTVEGALPGRDDDCRRICRAARELLKDEAALPFGDPVYWASFYAAGDGAIRADEADRRVPGDAKVSSKRRGSG